MELCLSFVAKKFYLFSSFDLNQVLSNEFLSIHLPTNMYQLVRQLIRMREIVWKHVLSLFLLSPFGSIVSLLTNKKRSHFCLLTLQKEVDETMNNLEESPEYPFSL